MSLPTQKPATTPIPVQLSENEFTTCILPHLSMPKRGPRCTLGYHRLFNLILSVLYTGMQWKGLPVPTDTHGKPAIHYTTVYRAGNFKWLETWVPGVADAMIKAYRAFAKWADDGSLWQAFLASVRHLAAAQHLDLHVLHGDGTNTVAKKGGMTSDTRGTNTRRARKSSPSRTTM